IRRRTAGRLADAEREVELARFRLRWLAHGQPTSRSGPSLDQVGRRLQEVLLGPVAADLGDGPLVVVPPGRLHAVPWALLPALRDRVVSVAPSAAIWLRAKAIAAPPHGSASPPAWYRWVPPASSPASCRSTTSPRYR